MSDAKEKFELDMNGAMPNLSVLGMILIAMEEGRDVSVFNLSPQPGFAMQCGANLSNWAGVTQEQIEKYVKTLEIKGPTVIFADPSKVDLQLLANIDMGELRHEVLIVAAPPDGIAAVTVKAIEI